MKNMYAEIKGILVDKQEVPMGQYGDDLEQQQASRAKYTVVIDDLDKRVDIFINQVVREQVMKKHTGHVRYVGKLAAYLTWVLMASKRDDLVDVLISKTLREAAIHPDADLDIVAREAAMEQQYILKILERGYIPQSPFELDEKFGKRTLQEVINFAKDLEHDALRGLGNEYSPDTM